jgi:predicted transcriptional regulator
MIQCPHCKKYTLGKLEIKALTHIKDHIWWGATEIAEHLPMSVNGASNLLRHLFNAGYVQRTKNNRNKYLYCISPRGAETLRLQTKGMIYG